MHVTTRKIKDDSIVEVEILGVTHRLLIHEAGELVNCLKKGIEEATDIKSSIWCSVCGRFLGTNKNRPGPRMINCVCGHQEEFVERPWLASDISVEVLVDYIPPKHRYKVTFIPYSYKEAGSAIILERDEYNQFCKAVCEYDESKKSFDSDVFSMHVIPTASARYHRIIQKQADSTFGRMCVKIMHDMTDADVHEMAKRLKDSIVEYR